MRSLICSILFNQSLFSKATMKLVCFSRSLKLHKSSSRNRPFSLNTATHTITKWPERETERPFTSTRIEILSRDCRKESDKKSLCVCACVRMGEAKQEMCVERNVQHAHVCVSMLGTTTQTQIYANSYRVWNSRTNNDLRNVAISRESGERRQG